LFVGLYSNEEIECRLFFFKLSNAVNLNPNFCLKTFIT